MLSKSLVAALLVANASASTVNSEAVQIIEGILVGAIHAEGFDDITKCVTDSEHIVLETEQAIKDFKKGGATNVIEGLYALGHTFTDIAGAMQDCSSTKGDWAKLEKMAEIFKNPKDFVYHVGKDLFINKTQIYGDVQSAISDYDSKSFYNFGKDVGDAAAKTLIGQEEVEALPIKQVEQFMAGLIEGLIQKNHLKEINHCYNDVSGLPSEVIVAINDFKKKDIQDIFLGLQQVGKILIQMPKDFQDCSHMQKDIQAIEKFAQIFKNPKALEAKFLSNIVANLPQVGQDVQTMIYDVEGHKYGDAGKQIADVVVRSIGAIEIEQEVEALPKLPIKQVEQFMAGLIQGLIHKNHLKEINHCYHDVSGLPTEVMVAINDFKKKDMMDIFAGLSQVGKILIQLPKDFKDCSHMQKDIKAIEKFAQIFKDPKALEAKFLSNIVANLPQVGQDVQTMIYDVEGKKFKNAGVQIADVLVRSIGTIEIESSLY